MTESAAVTADKKNKKRPLAEDAAAVAEKTTTVVKKKKSCSEQDAIHAQLLRLWSYYSNVGLGGARDCAVVVYQLETNEFQLDAVRMKELCKTVTIAELETFMTDNSAAEFDQVEQKIQKLKVVFSVTQFAAVPPTGVVLWIKPNQDPL